jgi:hypothetical protein
VAQRLTCCAGFGQLACDDSRMQSTASVCGVCGVLGLTMRRLKRCSALFSLLLEDATE